MSTKDLTIEPVEVRDLPWVSALLQKVVDLSFSQYASREQIEEIMSKRCSPAALTDEMRLGNQFIKLVLEDAIQGVASYRTYEPPVELRVDKLYALPGELEEHVITVLLEYIKDRACQTGYERLSLTLAPGEQPKIEMLTKKGFQVRGTEKVAVCDDFQMDAYVLITELKAEQIQS